MSVPGPNPASYASIDDAASQRSLGQRRSVFRPFRPSPVPNIIGLTVAAVMAGFVCYLLGYAGLLTSFFGIGFILLFVVIIGGGVVGMLIKGADARSGQEMHIFDHGVVIRGPKGRILPYRWDETRLMRYGIRAPYGTVARWSYGLLSPATPPVMMGQAAGGVGTMIANSDGIDLANMIRVAEFERIHEWGPALEDAITRVHVPMVLDALAAGRTVEFGPAVARPDGLRLDGNVIAWSEITELAIDNGYLRVKRQGKLFRSSVLANNVPNFLVLAAVVERFSGVSFRGSANQVADRERHDYP